MIRVVPHIGVGAAQQCDLVGPYRLLAQQRPLLPVRGAAGAGPTSARCRGQGVVAGRAQRKARREYANRVNSLAH